METGKKCTCVHKAVCSYFNSHPRRFPTLPSRTTYTDSPQNRPHVHPAEAATRSATAPPSLPQSGPPLRPRAPPSPPPPPQPPPPADEAEVVPQEDEKEEMKGKMPTAEGEGHPGKLSNVTRSLQLLQIPALIHVHDVNGPTPGTGAGPAALCGRSEANLPRLSKETR